MITECVVKAHHDARRVGGAPAATLNTHTLILLFSRTRKKRKQTKQNTKTKRDFLHLCMYHLPREGASDLHRLPARVPRRDGRGLQDDQAVEHPPIDPRRAERATAHPRRSTGDSCPLRINSYEARAFVLNLSGVY